MLIDVIRYRNECVSVLCSAVFGRGSVCLRRSKVEPYTEMWQVMNHSQEFRASDEDGITSVINANGHFAYFMESSSIEYYVERRCQLTQVGGLLDNKGYGIGVGPRE